MELRENIKWFEWLYQISSIWRVKSLDRIISRCNWTKISVKEKILKNKKSYKWYGIIWLNLNGNTFTKYIHRLVSEAFIQNSENKKTVNHKDWNKLNNSISNLERATYHDNAIHSYQKLWRIWTNQYKKIKTINHQKKI